MSFNKLIIVLVLTFSIGLSSCKKGENDQFISLKSRDMRITGNWELINSEMIAKSTEIQNGNTIEENLTIDIIDGLHIEYYYAFNSALEVTESHSDTFAYSLEIDIEKDGYYTMTELKDSISNIHSSRWKWLSTTKKKSLIYLDNKAYEIDRLTDEEMILKSTQTKAADNIPDSSNFVSSYMLTRKFKKNK